MNTPLSAPGGPAPPPAADDERPISYLRVLGPVALVSLLLVAVCISGFIALSTLRAYVVGESLKSKARAEAVGHLWHYALTRDAADFGRFEAALEPAVGDRIAREELARGDPDTRVVEQGLVQGGNHPSDVRSMIALYRCCSGLPLVRDAMDAWAECDRLTVELRTVGHEIMSASLRGERLAPLLGRLSTLDTRMIDAGRRFSAALGEASRVFTMLLTAGVVGLTALSVWAATALARRDLNRHSAHKEELWRAMRRWELAARSGGLGLFEWEVNSDVMRFDARACEMLGLDAEGAWRTLDRAAVRRLIHPDDRPTTRAALERSADEDAMLVQRFRICRPDGHQRHIEATGLMEPATNAMPRMVGVLRDVSAEVERGQMELERTAAERVGRARIEFLSRLSHELRTPLNAVLGFSELMQQDPSDPLSDNQRVRLGYIVDSGRHLLAMVNEVLDMSRIDAGGLGITLAPTPLQQAVDAALKLVEAECRSNGVRIVPPRPNPDLCVWGDLQRLTQSLSNLLSNACKYNRRGGHVWVELRRDEQDVFIAVRDEGEGLPPAAVAQLFQPFKRLHASSSIAGTGLGLVIVKLLVEKMGGSVHVHSEQGKGTTFTLRLRHCEATEPQIAD